MIKKNHFGEAKMRLALGSILLSAANVLMVWGPIENSGSPAMSTAEILTSLACIVGSYGLALAAIFSESRKMAILAIAIAAVSSLVCAIPMIS